MLMCPAILAYRYIAQIVSQVNRANMHLPDSRCSCCCDKLLLNAVKISRNNRQNAFGSELQFHVTTKLRATRGQEGSGEK